MSANFQEWLQQGDALYQAALKEYHAIEAQLDDLESRLVAKQAGYLASLGGFEAQLGQPDAARIRSDFGTALTLDPANVPLRLDYAGILEQLGRKGDAREQYEKALWYNDQLAEVEVERLPPAKVAEIRAVIERLSKE